MIAALSGNPHHDHDGICNVPVSHKVTLGEIVDLLDEFKKYDHNLGVPDLTPGSFSKKLYATYLSYLPKNKIAYDLKMNCDSRGSFTEIIPCVLLDSIIGHLLPCFFNVSSNMDAKPKLPAINSS